MKKFLVALLALATVICALPICVSAADAIEYIDENGQVKTIENYIPVTKASDLVNADADEEVWYVFGNASNLSIEKSVTFSAGAKVNFIIADDCTYTVKGLEDKTVINAPKADIAFYSGVDCTSGQMIINGGYSTSGNKGNTVGINCKTISVYGASLSVNGGAGKESTKGGTETVYSDEAGPGSIGLSCTDLLMNGGSLTVKGGNAGTAKVRTSDGSSMEGKSGGVGISCTGNLTVNDGTLTVTGGAGSQNLSAGKVGAGGAAITMASGSSLIINGGIVNVTGGTSGTQNKQPMSSGGVAINAQNADSFTVSGGEIVAVGATNKSAINATPVFTYPETTTVLGSKTNYSESGAQKVAAEEFTYTGYKYVRITAVGHTHTWTKADEYTHNCPGCSDVESHIDSDRNDVCDDCGAAHVLYKCWNCGGSGYVYIDCFRCRGEGGECEGCGGTGKIELNCPVCHCTGYVKGVPVIFETMSLTLDGSIGINFYVQINDMDYVGENAYMTMEFDNFVEKMTENVLLKDSVYDSEKGKYKFTFHVNSLQMAERVNATFYYGEGEYIARNASVKTYAEALVLESTNVKSVNLANAILTYGYYAQLACQETHGFTIGDGQKYDAMPTPVNTPNTSVDLSDYQLTVGGENESITKLSMSLALDNKTDIYIYVTTDTEPTVTGANVEIVKIGSRYRITVPNIAAHELATTYNLDIGGLTVDVSAFSYVYSVLGSQSRSANYKLAVAALYEYYLAAIAYAAK